MEVDGFLADSVVSSEGKLFVQGAGWDLILVTSLPVRHPRVGIGLIVRVPYTATNEPHTLDMRLEDGDGKELPLGQAPPGGAEGDGRIRRVRAPFTLGRPPHLAPGDDQVMAMAANFDGLVFESADRYRFVVSIDEVDAKHLPLTVRLQG